MPNDVTLPAEPVRNLPAFATGLNLLQQAVHNNASPETIKMLIELRDRMIAEERKADFEHVRVYWPWDGGEPRYLDMFVDEDGIGKRLPVNRLATSIYHLNVIVHDPHGLGSEESIAAAPRIHGVAVLFQKPVWS